MSDCRLTPTAPWPSHEGFQNALNAIWPDIPARIEARRTGSERPIFFTGHSLGGALAVLAADKPARADVMPAAIYTFGMPRAGNRDFAAIYNARLGERTFRLVHGGDIVACIPEWVVQPKKRLKREPFQHVGHLLKCPAGQKFARAAQLAPLDSNEPRFRAGLRENLVNRIGAMSAGTLFAPPGPGLFGSLYRVMPLSIRDHLPDRYRAALEP